MIAKALSYSLAVLLLSHILCWSPLRAAESDPAARTLHDIKGVQVTVEELQPNLLKYAKRQELTKEQLQASVESQLRAAGLKVLGRDEWLQYPGRPVLYINVNTHEYQKYQFAYDVRIELRQVVSLEAAPGVKALAATWSTNMTGVVNIGTADNIKEYVKQLVETFLSAYTSANKK